jgi:hypothetical protein
MAFNSRRFAKTGQWGVCVERGLEKLIVQKKTTIVKKWFDFAVQAYAPDTARFLKSQKDAFANPVGSNTLKGLLGLLEELLKDFDRRAIATYLDPIIRIRAAQALTPSQAASFILALKKVLRDTFAQELEDNRLAAELVRLESKIDQFCLMAFDIYMECREKIYQIRANETRNQVFRAFERAGLISEVTVDRP